MTATKKLLSVDVQDNGTVVVLFDDSAVMYQSMDALQFEIMLFTQNMSNILQLLLLLKYIQDGSTGKTIELDTIQSSNLVTING